jgi:hypothetical protein
MYCSKIVFLALFALLLTACGGAVSTLPPAQDQATQAPEQPADSGALLQDDFSNPDSGWDRVTVEEGSTDYQDGGYRIFVNTTDYSIWANPNQTTYQDVSVEVDAQKIGGPDDNEFGIVCRHADPGNFYAAVISSDGFFGFYRRIDGGTFEALGSGNFESSDAINLGSESNHIRLDCVGSTLTLYANGTMLGTASDSSIASGDVGLYAGTFATTGTDILFDNFVVRQP